MEVTDRGRNLKEYTESLKYLNDCLSNDLEKWERKEYEEVRKDTIESIKSIKERTIWLNEN